MRMIMIVVAASIACGCGSKVTAMDACKKLEAAQVASNCREDKPMGVGAAAIEKAAFDLPSVPGKGGQVLRYDKADLHKQAVETMAKTALLAGPHRYANDSKMILVQFNDGASLEVGKKAKAVVDSL